MRGGRLRGKDKDLRMRDVDLKRMLENIGASKELEGTHRALVKSENGLKVKKKTYEA